MAGTAAIRHEWRIFHARRLHCALNGFRHEWFSVVFR
jgi:hypothetical protein